MVAPVPTSALAPNNCTPVPNNSGVPSSIAAPLPSPTTVAVAVAPTRDAEMTFLQKDGVRVTSTRFIVPGQTYAMAGVTSVRFEKVNPSIGLPVMFILFGLVLLLFESTRVIGILFLLAGVVWVACLKPTYAVSLSSASGEIRAIQSKDSNHINSIVNALNEAIIYRR